jgi:hypothetical protein
MIRVVLRQGGTGEALDEVEVVGFGGEPTSAEINSAVARKLESSEWLLEPGDSIEIEEVLE